MPKTTKQGKAKKSELPSTVARSGPKAQRTYAKAYDSAAEQYGPGERAARTAIAALKRGHEKVGDRWEKKKGRTGPSDARAAEGGRNSRKRSAGGVDANASKDHLLGVAKRLDVKGRSRMKKQELVAAIQKANDRRTAKARR